MFKKIYENYSILVIDLAVIRVNFHSALKEKKVLSHKPIYNKKAYQSIKFLQLEKFTEASI